MLGSMMQCLQNEAESLSGDARETSRRMGGGDDLAMLLSEKSTPGTAGKGLMITCTCVHM